ncbi:MAG: phosphotransferase [Chloroflexi bacterium]|nr:phosphotransferase [Chloroflexota bacterium]
MSLSPISQFALRPPIETFAIGQGSNSRTAGVHTGDGDFLWKHYQPVHTEASIRYEHRLLLWLAAGELSFAVPTPAPNREGDTLCVMDDGLHALFPLIPGGPVDYADPRQLENVGGALAELQPVLARYPTAPRSGMTGFDALATVHPAISNPHTHSPPNLGLPEREPFASLLAWWREEVAALQSFIDGPLRALPRQVIHGDFVPSNTLHRGDQLTAVVDFEFAGPDARALDVASGLYYSLRVWKGDDPWPRGEAFGRGYLDSGNRPNATGQARDRWADSRNQARLTDAERAALPWLMRLRNGVSKIFWLGKSLADGTTEKQVLEIGDLQRFNRWLTINGERLEGLCGE